VWSSDVSANVSGKQNECIGVDVGMTDTIGERALYNITQPCHFADSGISIVHGKNV
jgi:hypothetical protein